MKNSEILLAIENQSKKFEELLRGEFRKFEERLDRTDCRIAAVRVMPSPAFSRTRDRCPGFREYSVVPGSNYD
jgi:hypothetical protein